MERIKKLLKRLINKETILYIVFGALTTLVSLSTFVALNYILKKTGLSGTMILDGRFWDLISRFIKDNDVSYLISNTASWVFAVALAFVTNKLFVFESKTWKAKVVGREVATFVGARLFSFFLDTVSMFLFVSVAGINENIAKIIVQVVVVVLNYIFSKLFVFKKPK